MADSSTEFEMEAIAERRIPSRYVESVRGAFDPSLRQELIVRSFREGLVIAQSDAERRRIQCEDQLAHVLESLAATRHRLPPSSPATAELRNARDTLEQGLEHWQGMLALIEAIFVELNEHHGTYTDAFMQTMELATAHLKTAPWNDPVRDPWSSLTTILTPALITGAQEAPAVPVINHALRIEARSVWSIAEASKARALVPAATPSTSVPEERDAREGTALPPSPAAPTLPRRRRSVSAQRKAAPSPSVGGHSAEGSRRTSSSVVAGPTATPPLNGADAAATPPGGRQTPTVAAPPNASVSQPPSAGLRHTYPPLRITCLVAAAAPESDPLTVDMVYVGAANGAVLGIPVARLRDPSGELSAAAAASINTTSQRGRAASKIAAAATQQQQQRSANRSTIGSPVKRSETRQTPSQQHKQQQQHPNAGPYAGLDNIAAFPAHLYPVRALSAFVAKETRFLASASDDKTVRVYNASTKDLLFLLANNRSVIAGLVYHPTLMRLLLAGCDGSISLMEPTFGRSAVLLPPDHPLGPIHSISVSRPEPVAEGGEKILVGFRSGAVLSFASPESPRACSSTRLSCVGAYLSDTDTSLATADLPFTVLPGCVCRGGHTHPVTCALAPHPPLLFTGDASGRVILWYTTEESPQRHRVFQGHVDAVSAIAVTSDGFLLTASRDATVIAWSWIDGSQLRRCEPHFHHITGMLLCALPKAKVDVASLIASATSSIHSSGPGGGDRWSGTLSLAHLPGVLECTMITASTDGTVALSAVVYDTTQEQV